jgi:hypothetical protein
MRLQLLSFTPTVKISSTLKHASRSPKSQPLADVIGHRSKVPSRKPHFPLNALFFLAFFCQPECSQHVARVQPTNIVVFKIVITGFIAIIK